MPSSAAPSVSQGSRALTQWAFGALAVTVISLGALVYAAAASGQEPSPDPIETPSEKVGTVTEAENIPREAEQAPELESPLSARAAQELLGKPAPRDNQPLPPPTKGQGTTAAAMTAPPARIDFRRFGVRFAESPAPDAQPTPAEVNRAGALTIGKVRKPSAASRLGLEQGDEIISVGNQPVTNLRSLNQALEELLRTGPRDQHVAIPLVVERGSGQQTLTISNSHLTAAGYGPLLTEYGHYVPPQFVTGYRGSAADPNIPGNPTGAYLGVELNNQYRSAAIVSRVLPGTPAAAAGLQEGDRIFAINNRPVESPNELIFWVGQMQPGDTIEISFDRAHDVDVQLGTRSARASEPAASPSPTSDSSQ